MQGEKVKLGQETQTECVSSFGRRRFLQGSVAALGGIALGSISGCSPNSLSETETTQNETQEVAGVIGPDEQIFQGCCHSICGGNARLNVHVRDGKIVKTSKFNSPYDTELDHICTRGLVHAQRTYAPERPAK